VHESVQEVVKSSPDLSSEHKLKDERQYPFAVMLSA
jgi:hypothetical protein